MNDRVDIQAVPVRLGLLVVFLAALGADRCEAQIPSDKVAELVNHLWYPYDRAPRERAKMRAEAVAELAALVDKQGDELAKTLCTLYGRSGTEPRMKAYIVQTLNRIGAERPGSGFAREGHAFCRKLVRDVVPVDLHSRTVWIEATNNLKLNRDLTVVPAYIERFTDPNMTPRFRKARVETFNVLLGTHVHPLSVQRPARLEELREYWTQWWKQNAPYAEYYFPRDPETGKPVWRSPGIRINRLTLSRWRLSTDRLIASAGADDRVRLWDGRGGVVGHVLYGAEETVVGLAIHPKASTVAFGDALGNLYVCRVLDGELVKRIRAHKHSIWDLDFDPTGDLLVSAGADGDVHVWDTRTWTRQRTVRVGETIVYTARFSPDGRTIAAGVRDGTLRLFGAGSGSSVRTLGPTKHGAIYALAFRPDGARLTTGTRAGMSLIWDVASGKVIGQLKVGADPVTGVAWVMKGNGLVTADMGARVLAWNPGTQKVFRGYQSRGEPLYALAVSADGQWLAAGGRNRLVSVWSVHEGTRVRVLHGHHDAVMNVRFAPVQKTKVLMTGVPRFGYVVDWIRSNSYYAAEAPPELRQKPLANVDVSAPTLNELVARIADKVGCKCQMTDKAIRFLP